MPRSFTILDLITSFPVAFNISAILHPRKLFLRCPRCKGLLVFGEEYSTMIFLPVEATVPNFLSLAAAIKNATHQASATVKLRNPFTRLKFEKIVGCLASKCLPKVSPSIGSARPVFFINGNRTTV